ncbi:pyridoxal phosphate-dependent aminotransferase [Chelonobacter oris]|uniref:pyridoxal phosphate-dependent aminotransferase n=1 Tax=Chelonobacter oris TaxID=505317 RepID=UPI0024490143|nr:histidinol-phosphate transaminase [Chelonobacter oris]
MTSTTKISISRRSLLRGSATTLAGLSVSSFAIGKTAAAVAENAADLPDFTASNSPFQIPTQDAPLMLHFNENPIGMSLKAQKAAIQAIPMANRYADPAVPPLRKLAADYHKVKEDNILFSAGSSDAIRICIAAHASPETQFVIPDLTYGDGEFFANAYGLKITKIPSNPNNWAIDLNGMQSAVADYSGPSIVYLVNPNNPTSTIVNSAEVESWIKSKPKGTIFIIDEAYAEFVNNPDYRSVDHLIAEGLDNVLLLKTFSKIHAMAGMRVGYTVATAEKIKQLSIYVEDDALTLSYPSILAATESMKDKPFLQFSKKSNDVAKSIYIDLLKELQLEYLPSETNFIFHRIPGELATFKQRMQEQHILVGRAFPPADGWCRMSIGTPDEMIYVAEKMREFRKKGWV